MARPFFPNLVGAATKEPLRHVLDWFIFRCACARLSRCYPASLATKFRPLQVAQASIERARHLLWHGRPAQADQALLFFASHTGNIDCGGPDSEEMVTE